MGIMISLILSPTNHNFIGTGVNVIAYVESAKAEVTNNVNQISDNNSPVQNNEKSEDVDKNIAENDVITSIASIIIPVNDQVEKTDDNVTDDGVTDNLVEEDVLIDEFPTTDPSQESLQNDNDTIIEDQFAYPASISQNNHVKTLDINNLIEDDYQNNLWFWILLLLIISIILLFIWCLLKEKEEKENNETN